MSTVDKGWIGVDLDGTLAEYHGWVKWCEIGKPIPLMVERVRGWLAERQEVKIFTARVASRLWLMQTCYKSKEVYDGFMMRSVIRNWCSEHVKTGWCPEVTCVKDLHMIEQWDDRAVGVVINTGQTLADAAAEEARAQLAAPL